MRNPLAPTAAETVAFYNGTYTTEHNQTGGTLYYRPSGGSWSQAALGWDSNFGNGNQYWKANLPGGTFAPGATIQYCFGIAYGNADDTYLGTTNAGAGSAKFATLAEAQANAYSFTYWAPIPSAPVALPASGIGASSLTANWSASAGATNYFLDVATDSGFNSFVAGYQNLSVGNVLANPVTGLTQGTTYHYRVRAQSAGGTSGNSDTITLVLQLPAVSITNLVSSTASGVATVVVATTDGAVYGVHVTDAIPASGTPTWAPLMVGQAGDGTAQSRTDAGAAGVEHRFYQVALTGHTPPTNNMWGVVRRTAKPGYTLMAPPVRTDRKFNGELGAMLAEPLEGSAFGQKDKAYILESSGSWRTLYLDDQKVWRESGGAASAYELPAGAGFFVERKSGSATPVTFTGPVGNDGTRTNRLVTGWNMIGLSEGKTLPIKDTFQNANPVGSATEEQADLVVLQNPDGSWRRLIYIQGWGAPYDGNWFDLQTFDIVTNKLEPGAAYYYYRQPSGGATEVKF
jgi:hypothetical protein